MNHKPYLSIVITSRNDDYQGNGFIRMQTSVNSLLVQAKQYNLRAELIIVDWNPPSDKPLLKDAVFLPDDLGPSIVRFITVPSSIHKTYRCSDKIKIITVAALNVGIRRAEGEFIWTTNSDLLFSDELMRFLSSEKLERDCFYRAFRYDVNGDVLKYNSQKERLDFCKNNIIQAFLETKNSIHGLPNYPILQTGCGADFIVFSKEYWERLHGYPEINNLGFSADVLLCYMAYLAGLEEKVLEKSMRVYHIDHDSRWRHLSRDRVYSFFKDRVCDWIGYPDKWKTLLRQIYIFQNKFSNFFVNIFYSLFGSFLKKYSDPESWDFNLKYLHWEFRKLLISMLKNKRSYVYNDDNWGLPNENFAEFIIKN